MNNLYTLYEARLRQISDADWNTQFVSNEGVVKEIGQGYLGLAIYKIARLLDLQDKFLGKSSEALKYMIVSVAHTPSFLSTEQKLSLALSAAESFNKLVAKVERQEGLAPFTLYNVRIIDADIYENFLDLENNPNDQNNHNQVPVDPKNQTVTVAIEEVEKTSDAPSQMPIVTATSANIEEVDDEIAPQVHIHVETTTREQGAPLQPSLIIQELDDTNSQFETDKHKETTIQDFEKVQNEVKDTQEKPSQQSEDADIPMLNGEKVHVSTTQNIHGDTFVTSLGFTTTENADNFTKRQDALLKQILENHKITPIETTQKTPTTKESTESQNKVSPVQADLQNSQNSEQSNSNPPTQSQESPVQSKESAKEKSKEFTLQNLTKSIESKGKNADSASQNEKVQDDEHIEKENNDATTPPDFIVQGKVAGQIFSLFKPPYVFYREVPQTPSQLPIGDAGDAVLGVAKAQGISEMRDFNSGSGSGSQGQGEKSQDNNPKDQGQNQSRQNRFTVSEDEESEVAQKTQAVQSRVNRLQEHVDFSDHGDDEMDEVDESKTDTPDAPFERPVLYPEVFKVLRTLKEGQPPFQADDTTEQPAPIKEQHLGNRDVDGLEKESQLLRNTKIKQPNWIEDSLDDYRNTASLATVLQKFSTLANKINKNAGVHLATQDPDNGEDFFYFVYGLGRIEGANKLQNDRREGIKINYSGRYININLDNVKGGYKKLPLREKLWLYQLASQDNAPLTAESKEGVAAFLKNGLDAALEKATQEERQAVNAYIQKHMED